eukprot:10086531-Ditylum_brightwellii.AAC.1
MSWMLADNRSASCTLQKKDPRQHQFTVVCAPSWQSEKWTVLQHVMLTVQVGNISASSAMLLIATSTR